MPDNDRDMIQVSRYTWSGSAGIRGRNRYAVLDRLERDEHGGMLRVSWHRTAEAARRAARRLNDA